MAAPKEGDTAPDFTLPGTAGDFTLSAHRGRRVLLLFYPGDDTPTCTKQFCSYRDESAEMAALDAEVVGISAQGLDSHVAFQSKYGLDTPLLADEGGKVAKSYGVWRPVIGTQRAVIAIDEQGVIRHRHTHLIGLGYQGVDELKQALASF